MLFAQEKTILYTILTPAHLISLCLVRFAFWYTQSWGSLDVERTSPSSNFPKSFCYYQHNRIWLQSAIMFSVQRLHHHFPCRVLYYHQLNQRRKKNSYREIFIKFRKKLHRIKEENCLLYSNLVDVGFGYWANI